MFRFFKSGNKPDKEIRKLTPVVEKINRLEPEFEALDDNGLRAKTEEFKTRINQGETTDDLLPEAFAAVRATDRRHSPPPGEDRRDENR